MEVDPQFRAARNNARKRKRQRLVWRLMVTAGVLIAMAGIAAVWIWLSPAPQNTVPVLDNQQIAGANAASDVISDDTDETLTQVETAASEVSGRPSAAFVDIAGDPMILNFASSQAGMLRVAGPATLPDDRIGLPRADRLSVVTDTLIVREQRLMMTLPSSREDFAFFQTQRNQALLIETSAPVIPALDAATEASLDATWGAVLGNGGNDNVAVNRTRIQNTTSTVTLRPESTRPAIHEDIIVRLRRPQTVLRTLTEKGIAAEQAQSIVSGATEFLDLPDPLPVGVTVAMRVRKGADGVSDLIQMSVFSADEYLGSIARFPNGRIALAADPWVGTDIDTLDVPDLPVGGVQADIRMLDGFYSAAIRNGVPTSIIGETIVMLSQAHDLDGDAQDGDRMVLIYGQTPRDANIGPAQILFAGIQGPSGNKNCYVVAQDGGGFGCFQETRSGAATPLGGGLAVPVAGTISARFGPSSDPVLGTVTDRKGIDWSAPIGTPVHAALAGSVATAGAGDAVGNLIVLDHPNSVQTRYAHLDRFGAGITPGAQVTKGQLIGYVGNTGQSTGPHLYFELRENGQPVDPMLWGQGDAGSESVQRLVNQIIRVESGGNATAQNPRSTATGLGQFIESTWIRMMRSYRPDLAGSLSRRDLLALRNDPTLSRIMVTNLARENESYLRARGHAISPGRLYLAHFLGPGGADTALRSVPGNTVLSVMGAGVVRANPFLSGYTINDLERWADRKMGRLQGASTTSVAVSLPVVVPPEVQAFKRDIDAILTGLDN